MPPAQAHLWFDQLASGEARTVREIVGREKINEHEITRVLHLAFLSPRIVEDIFKGRQAEDVTVYRLRRLSSLPTRRRWRGSIAKIQTRWMLWSDKEGEKT